MRFSPGCCWCGFPCPPCPGGLPGTLYLTVTAGPGCLAGQTFPLTQPGWNSKAPYPQICGCDDTGSPSSGVTGVFACEANTVAFTIYFTNFGDNCYYATSGSVVPDCDGPVVARMTGAVITRFRPCDCDAALIGQTVDAEVTL
jgi:hypothetical protein